MTPEFSLIAKYFTRRTSRAVLGVGDDCALITVANGHELAISTDTLVSGTHFFPDADAELLGHKALAVNLSDLAAMGAAPRYVTLALSLPVINEDWLAAFARGFFALAGKYDVELIGGDTTRGPLSLTLTVLGEVPRGSALRRDAAKTGDDIWVSGDLGGAALALAHLQSKVVLNQDVFERAASRLHMPAPRIELGLALREVASAAIDVSDGLLADLGHICQRSNLAAVVEWHAVPLSSGLSSLARDGRMGYALSGGDDYELCFTADESMRGNIQALAAHSGLALTRIGKMRPGVPVVQVLDESGHDLRIASVGFDHFQTSP